MIKKIVLLFVLGFSLTGCVMAPYDDRPNYSGNYSGGYYSSDRPYWNNAAGHRPDYRLNNRPNYRLHPQPKLASHRPPLNGNKPPLHGQKPPTYKPPPNRPNGYVSTNSYPPINKSRSNQAIQKPRPNRPNMNRNKPNWNSTPQRPVGLKNIQRPLRSSV